MPKYTKRENWNFFKGRTTQPIDPKIAKHIDMVQRDLSIRFNPRLKVEILGRNMKPVDSFTATGPSSPKP
jgi:hypothetical protein